MANLATFDKWRTYSDNSMHPVTCTRCGETHPKPGLAGYQYRLIPLAQAGRRRTTERLCQRCQTCGQD